MVFLRVVTYAYWSKLRSGVQNLEEASKPRRVVSKQKEVSKPRWEGFQKMGGGFQNKRRFQNQDGGGGSKDGRGVSKFRGRFQNMRGRFQNQDG